MSLTQTDNDTRAVPRRKVEADDLYRFRLLADPQASPDGRIIAYVQTRLRKKKNDYASNIWLIPSDGDGEPAKLTNSDKRDLFPRWSPKGDEIAFLSTRSGNAQIWVIRVAGGEARQLTRVKRGVEELAWSPDGRWVAFVSTVDNDEDKKRAREAQPAQGGENREPGSGDGELAAPMRDAGAWEEDDEDEAEDVEEGKGAHASVVTRLSYKADGAGLLQRRAHLFIVPSAGGKPSQLTEGDWDVGSLRWSPDGKSLAFLSNQEPDADYLNVQDVFVLPISDDGRAGEIRRVSNHDTAIMNLDWLPNGDGFALFAHRRIEEAALATNPQLWTLSLRGEMLRLAEGFDRPIGGWISGDLRAGTGETRARFSPDGSTVYFLVTDQGNVHVFSAPLDGGEVTRVVGGERQTLNFAVVEGGIVFAASTPTNPNDLFRVDLDGGNELRLTDVNADILCALELSEPREFWLERPDGVKVHGWTLLPHDYKEGEKYPLILQIHGGPHMSYGNVYFHEFQLLAARGHVVLYTNPRGSQGYGQSYSDAIRNDWAGVDYDDLIACVDHAISLGNVDDKRLGVAGGSYGGYMSAWIIGHDERFRAAVASRMVSNLYSAWGSGDFTWQLWNWEFEGTPQQRTALYLERSPITYVERMRAPLLITHAEDDLRTSIEQSEQLYVALKLLKREVKMVRFPSGGHDISRTGKPSLRVERLGHICDWFELWSVVGSR